MTDPKEINTIFQQFYQDLNTAHAPYSLTEIDSFLDKLNIPSIDSNQHERLEKPITTAGILQAIQSLQNSKAPGPDGFTCDFYKAFTHKRIPLLCDVFSETHATTKLPQTLTQATTSVILKKDRDP